MAQVHIAEEVKTVVYAGKLLSLYADAARVLRAGGDIDRVMLAAQLIEAHVPSHFGVREYVYAHLADRVDFLFENGLGQAVFGYAHRQHSARHGLLLVHGDVIAQLAQIVAAGQPRGPASDDAHRLVVVGEYKFRIRLVGLHRRIGRKPLQVAYGHRLVQLAPAAAALAWMRADAPAYRRKRVLLANEPVRVLRTARRDQRQVTGHIDAGRARVLAGRQE